MNGELSLAVFYFFFICAVFSFAYGVIHMAYVFVAWLDERWIRKTVDELKEEEQHG